MAKLTLKLELTVRYDLNGEEPVVMEQNLRRLMNRAIDDGLLTGATAAEVDEYSYDIIEMEVPHA